jgi:hypothetical protein
MSEDIYINPPKALGAGWAESTRIFQDGEIPIKVLQSSPAGAREYVVLGPAVGSPLATELAGYAGTSVATICAYLDGRVLATAVPNSFGVSNRWWRTWANPSDGNLEYRVCDSKYTYDIINAL